MLSFPTALFFIQFFLFWTDLINLANKKIKKIISETTGDLSNEMIGAPSAIC
jgi:hypothetical protein